MIARGGGAILYTGSIAAYIGSPRRVATPWQVGDPGSNAACGDQAWTGRHPCKRNRAGVHHASRPEDIFRPEIIQHAKDIALVKSRIGHPGDVAALSALLMSEEGSFITGQSIAIDGGVTLRP